MEIVQQKDSDSDSSGDDIHLGQYDSEQHKSLRHSMQDKPIEKLVN